VADDGDHAGDPDRAVLQRLEAALATLTPDQNRLLWYRIIAQWSWSELGAELGVARSAAKRRYQRLLARLSRACAAPDDLEPTTR
jgi:RNA polymerase sigma factor (sigma-70 family)